MYIECQSELPTDGSDFMPALLEQLIYDPAFHPDPINRITIRLYTGVEMEAQPKAKLDVAVSGVLYATFLITLGVTVQVYIPPETAPTDISLRSSDVVGEPTDFVAIVGFDGVAKVRPGG